MEELNSTAFVIYYACLLTPTYNLISLVVAVVVFVTTIFGNLFILISLCKYPTRFKGSVFMFIGNIAAADLLLGIWMVLFIYEEMIPEVKQNWYFCMIKPFGIIVSYTGSTICLLGLSFDRFMAVFFPFVHLVNTRRRKFYISLFATIWLVSVIGTVVPLFLEMCFEQQKTLICRIGTLIPEKFEFISSILMSTIIMVSLVFYGLVIWKIRGNIIPGQNSGRKLNSKMTISLLVNILFAVCWLPFIICSFIEQFWHTPSVSQNVACITAYLSKFAFINSSLNWVVYGLANKTFRRTFKSLMWSIWSMFIRQPAQPLNPRTIAVVNQIAHYIDSSPNIVTRGEMHADNTIHNDTSHNICDANVLKNTTLEYKK